MAEIGEEEQVSKIAPELRGALRISLFLQAIIIGISAFVLSGAWVLQMTVIAEIIFWAWYMFLVFLRGEKPTWLDLLAVKWGFPAVWIASFFIVQGLGLWRGA